MEYQAGRPGRIIVARLHEGEELYPKIEGLARRENVQNAAVLVVGGLRKARVVVGPKDTSGPIEPVWKEFDDAREIAGVGTIFRDESGPKLHLHGAIGRGDEAIAGCPRGGATVFLVLEVVIIEIEGIDAERAIDARSGLKLLKLAAAASY
ncbi:MAG: PPC domain-containing DNA-binding protein [Phycisphaerae bacterium]